MAVRNFRELREKMSPERRAINEAETERMLREMALDQLRAARELTQQNLAQIFGVSQGSISRLERRTDMYVSTLAKFIEAMGGQLEIRAVFPDGSVRINQFGADANRTA
ncbi:MAG: XRE family transcriptional regulator [Bryobacteraceae bacterium]|jgi:DNA-binding XRE family transcriptional regulator